MLKFVMRMLNERVSFPYRYTKLTEQIAPLLQDTTTVLDVGSGDGHLSRYLMEFTGCQMTGLDVCLQPHPYIDVHHYDGHTFPFADNAFDCVMMVDMLHHTNNIDRMLAEARRVARHFVIVKDHYWQNRMDRVALHLADYIGNIPYNVPLPYNFLHLEEWEAVFKRHHMGEISRSTFKYMPLEPAHHIMVKLRAEKPAITVYDRSEVEDRNAELQPANLP